MRSRHSTYLPITSIIIGIVILAVAVAAISYRDIGRGRRQVAELLWYQARALLTFASVDVRSELVSRTWQPERLQMFFQEVPAMHEGVGYLALLDEGGKALVSSDSEQVGEMFPTSGVAVTTRGVTIGAGPTMARMMREPIGEAIDVEVGTRIVETAGRRIYEYRIPVDLPPPSEAMHVSRRMGRMGGRPPDQDPSPGFQRMHVDPEVFAERLSSLLGRQIDADAPVSLTAVVGLDGTDLEATLHASRNYTLLLSAVLLVVGGAAIYFLFIGATYRSTRTALENMRSYTKNVIDSMASGLVSLDADGKVVSVNPGGRAILGLPGESGERAAGSAADAILRVEPARDKRALDDVLAGSRDVLELETRIELDGASVPVALSASSLRNEEGKRTGTVVLFQDLREIEALKAAVERERHLASLGRLAAGVAHEVRNPLSSLKGFAQLFRSKFDPGSEEERYSEIMIEEVERLDRVVQELLDFAKPQIPDRRPTSPNVIVEEALSLISEDAQFRSVDISLELGDGLPEVLVDPLQMRQAILNVLLNAMEAMEHGGTLTIRTAVSHHAPEGPPSVVLGVTDTGPGMDAEEISKLFEPFYTTKRRGTGLGLTVVSRVMEQNGGRVDVVSAPGAGTTVSLVLPQVGES
ncbi:MAG: PAS domain-containing protein [Candidatus Eisenbacteria bacterium]|nr:PAS domain-containing protein [Candidatus Eisenbacteria bacterium]